MRSTWRPKWCASIVLFSPNRQTVPHQRSADIRRVHSHVLQRQADRLASRPFLQRSALQSRENCGTKCRNYVARNCRNRCDTIDRIAVAFYKMRVGWRNKTHLDDTCTLEMKVGHNCIRYKSLADIFWVKKDSAYNENIHVHILHFRS